MPLTPVQMAPTQDFAAARRQYIEFYAWTSVMNTYLKVALVLMAVVQAGLIALCVRTQGMVQNFKPLVIRINDVGRAEAVRYAGLEYQPQEAEVRYFLTEFVTRHYSRMHATVRESYARSLYFLDGRLADALIESNKKSRVLDATFAGQGDEIEVQVKNVVVEDLRQAPYKATVDFEKVIYNPDRSVGQRERYVASVIFVFRSQVPNELVPVNPLGLTITYFRDDQAFK